MNKQQWAKISKKYRIIIQHEISIAKTLVALEKLYGFSHEHVSLLARVVLA